MQSCPQRIPTSAPEHKDLEELDGFENEPDELDELAELGADTEDEGTDLDVGVTIDEPPDALGDDTPATELDLGELLRPEPAATASVSDDEALPLDGDFDFGIEAVRDDGDLSDEEGAEEPEFRLDEHGLPALDADDLDGDSSSTDPDMLLIPSDRDDDAPPQALKLWYDERPLLSTENISTLLADRGVVIAASHDLFWVNSPDDPSECVQADAGAIAALALCSPSTEVVLAATRAGKLIRRARTGSTRDRASSIELENANFRAHVLGLAEISRGEVVLALLANGTLVRSSDGGETWSSAEAGHRFIQLSGAGQRAYALAVEERRVCLLHSDATGRNFQAIALPSELNLIARGTQPLLAAFGDVVAIAPKGHALWVSNDAGAHFSKVKGTADATALCAGKMGERACVWAALYSESRDSSDIVVIDAALAEALAIAQIEGGAQEDDFDPADQLEQGRVAALAWDASSERIWVGGAFGLRAFIPPRTHDS